MTIDAIKNLVKTDFDAVNALIIEKIQSQVGLIDDLSHHIVNSGGKRLRPLLALLSSRACGYSGENHIPLAAMVEFFHTATLLHDDVVDESTLRRGKETANEIWGSKASILVGDYLFTQSVKLMVSVNSMPVLSLLANTAHEITYGEVKQLNNRHNTELSFDDYFDIIRCKTALLFSAATEIGPLLSQNDELVAPLRAYGLHLGNAFQLIDDALDYCSDADTIGKNIGDDLADGKVTLPLIHAMKEGTDSQRELIKQSINLGSLEHLSEIQQTIDTTNAIDYTKQIAAEEVDKAISALTPVAQSEYKQALIDLAHYAIKRNH